MKKNITVVGCGYWGKNLVRNFSELGALYSICDPNTEIANKYAGQYNVKNSSFIEIINDLNIKGVVLAVPAHLHASMAIEAMNKGKHVFVEKPLAMNENESELMIATAKKNDVKLMVGHLLQYHPIFKKILKIVNANEIGELNYIYSNRLNFGKVRTEENALWSFAPHDVAVILRLLDEMPVEVACTGGSYLTPGLADVTVTTLLFQSDRRAHIFVSWLNPFKEQKLVVMGEQGMAVFNDVNVEDKLVLYDQRVDFQETMPVLQNDGQQVIALSGDEPLRRECEHYLECVATRRTPLTDAESGVRVLRVLEACQESMRQNGQPISLDEH